MEDSFLNNLGYLIAFLIFVLPRLLKLFRKRTAKQPVEPKPEETRTPPVAAEEEEEFDFSEMLPQVDQVDMSQHHAMVRRAEDALVRARNVATRKSMGGETVGQLRHTVETAVARPVQSIATELKRRVSSAELLTADEAVHIAANLDRLEALTDRLEYMIDRRMTPQYSAILKTLDPVADGCLFPYLAHARRLDLDYGTRHAMVVLGEAGSDYGPLFSSLNIAPVVVDEPLAERPFAWISIASDIALDVFYGVRGLARTVRSEVRVLPAPSSLAQYSDPKSLAAGLIGGWLPRLFADTGAALQLGPAFAAGLDQRMATASEADISRTIELKNPTLPPLYVRMFTALSALTYMGFQDEGKQRFETWNSRFGNALEFIVIGADGVVEYVPMAPVLEAVSGVVDYLLRTQFDSLGATSLMEIPRLRCGPARVLEMEQIAERFLSGEAVEASTVSILGAAQLAVEKSGRVEVRIAKTAMRSLLGEIQHVREPAAVPSAPLHIRGMFGSKATITKAIVAGAVLAPRTARSRRRL